MSKTFISILAIFLISLNGFWANGQNIFTNAVSNNWTDAGNWSGGLPETNEAVSIQGTVSISTAVSCGSVTINGDSRSITVNSGGTLTCASLSVGAGVFSGIAINSGGEVIVNGFMNNSAGVVVNPGGKLRVTGAVNNQITEASILINSGASLITESTIENNGTFKVSRLFQNDRWHLISLPVASWDSYDLFIDDYLQEWVVNDNTPANNWTWREITSPEEVLVKMKGYSFYRTDANATFGFTGTPNTGNQSIDLAKDDNNTAEADNKGWNLVGNPYPSGLNWADLDTTYGAIYYWDNNGYKSWNNGSGDGKSIVMPLQAFFIYVPSNGATNFSVSDSNRVHPTNLTYYKEAADASLLVLEATSPEHTDRLYIRWNETATGAFDFTTDAFKILSANEGVSMLYSLGDDASKLSIDQRPATESIPVGFFNSEPGIYEIALGQSSGLQGVVLEDTETGVFHPLAEGPYEFIWSETESDERFKLHFESLNIEAGGSLDKVLVFAHSGVLSVKGMNAGFIRVNDVMGREVLSHYAEGDDLIQLPLSVETGVYLVSIQQGAQTITHKVFIN